MRAERDAALKKLEELTAEQPQGEPVEKLTWEDIVGLVNEVLGCQAHEWPLPDVGHQMTGINFNSLARIIDRVQARYTRPAEQPAPVAVVLPVDWQDQLFAEMDRRFELRKFDEDHMANDDTQIGVEFAMKWIADRLDEVARLNPPQQ